MKRKKRSLIYFSTLLIVLICIFLTTITVSAASNEKDEIPIPTVRKDVYVYDEVNIINDDVEKQVNSLLIDLEKQTGAEVAVVTVKSLMNKEIEDYSYELANTLGIGKADEDNGVLLLVSESDGEVRLEAGRGLEGCLPDSRCGRILDNYFKPYWGVGECSQSTHETIKAVISVLAKEYGISSIDGIDHQIATEIEENEEEQAIKTILLIIVLIVILVCDHFFLNGTILRILLIIVSRGKSSSSSGGFGGGSFGGGGASRSR